MSDNIIILDETAAMKAITEEAEHIERLSGLLLLKAQEQQERLRKLVDNPPPTGEKV